MDTARLAALARKYMTETVSFQRTTGHGVSVAQVPIGGPALAYRLLKSGSLPLALAGGTDAAQVLRFVVDTPEDIRQRDVLIDANGLQYRVVGAARTLPGLPVELDCIGLQP